MVRPSVLISAALLLGALAGCRTGTSHPELDQQAATNEAMVRLIFDQAARNAVVTEHTVYPYHFVPNDAELNELGRRHVEALAAAHRRAPGPLNVSRGDVPERLYEARVQAVVRQMSIAGVDPAAIRVEDSLPGGRSDPNRPADATLPGQRPATPPAMPRDPGRATGGI